jgi:16S rRNA (adenine1518-N6/adenine1519-N6)-dimethyltransferase
MKLSEMCELLSARGIQLTKSLGQNFLHDGNQLRRIVGAAELTPADKVLEIGPGLGPLTELLLAQAGEVLAIEKDTRLVEVLRERFDVPAADGRARLSQRAVQTDSDCGALGQARPTSTLLERPAPGRRPALQLLHADALKFLRREARDWSGWKLVANLPYSVASPILVELAQSPQRPERMVATLQLEVAQRLMAKAGDADYGVLTLLVQLDYELRDWFEIPAGCFFPAPEVDSACVVLVRRVAPLLAEEHRRTYVKIVKRAFSQRRKMMFKLLKYDWPPETLERAFAAMNLAVQERAEKLSLEQFAALAAMLVGPSMKPARKADK